MIYLRAIALALAGGLLAIGPSTAGSWSFDPSLDLMQRYDSNVALVADEPVADFITRIGGELPVDWSGERSGVSVAYRLGYDKYLRNEELSNLTQYFRAGWRLDGARNDWNLYGSWGRTPNPRIGVEGGAEAPPTPGADPGFLVTRTVTDYWLLSTLYARSISSDWRLQARIDGTAARYDEPGLADNENYTTVIQADHESSTRNAWTTGLRYSIFQADGLPSVEFSAIQGGGTHRLARRLRATWLLGVVLEQGSTVEPGEEDLVVEPLSGTDRLYGLASLVGDYRRARWSFAYSSDFTSGSGVRVAVRRDRFGATAGWDVGRGGLIGIALSRSRNQGRDLNVNSDELDLRYSQSIRAGWSTQLAITMREQDGDNDGGPGNFLEQVYSVMFRYAGQRRS